MRCRHRLEKDKLELLKADLTKIGFFDWIEWSVC